MILHNTQSFPMFSQSLFMEQSGLQYSLLLFLVPRVCPSSRELEPTEELSWLSWWGSCRNPSLDSERVGVSVTDLRRSRVPSFLDLISFLIFRVIQLPLLSSTTQHIHCIYNTLLRPAEPPNFYARHRHDSDPVNVMESQFSAGTEQVCHALEICFILHYVHQYLLGGDGS